MIEHYILFFHPHEIGYEAEMYAGPEYWKDIPKLHELVEIRCTDGSGTKQYGRVIKKDPSRFFYVVRVESNEIIQPNLFE